MSIENKCKCNKCSKEFITNDKDVIYSDGFPKNFMDIGWDYCDSWTETWFKSGVHIYEELNNHNEPDGIFRCYSCLHPSWKKQALEYMN
jgi:hypothetical protein